MKTISQATFSLSVFAALAFLNACGDMSSNFNPRDPASIDANPQNRRGGGEDTPPDIRVTTPDIVDGPTTGVKTADQIQLTFAVLTGTEALLRITAYDPGFNYAANNTCLTNFIAGAAATDVRAGNCIHTRFNMERDSLPSTSLLSAYAAPHRIAILRLATDHCKAMVDRPQLRGGLVTDTEITQRASDVLPAGSMRRDQFIENIYNRFWTNRVAKVPAMNSVKVQLSELITALSTEVAATTVRSVAISACASALASTVTLVTY